MYFSYFIGSILNCVKGEVWYPRTEKAVQESHKEDTNDEEEYYSIVGRKKDMFISGGENVYPAEIEGVLATHPAIVEVAVIGRPDPKWGEFGLAVVVPRTATLTAEEVIAFCSDKLVRYKIPRAIVFTDALPRNAMGKVLKAELCAKFVE